MTDEEVLTHPTMQYFDALVTCELAAKFAVLDNAAPNKSIIHCWKEVRKRVKDEAVIKIFDDMVTNFFPLGRLTQMRREFDAMLG